MNKAGFVYFLLAENGACKIGKARNPRRRVEGFRRLTNLNLHLFHQIASNDAFWLESKFHRFFASVRIKGEWFALTSRQLASVAAIERRDRIVICGQDLDEQQIVLSDLGKHAAAIGSKGGKKGGLARMKALTPERRREIARMGACARNTKRKGASFPLPQNGLDTTENGIGVLT